MNIKLDKSLLSLPTVFRNPDKVVLFVILAMGLLFLMDASQGQASLLFLIDALIYILPFLLFAVILAASIKATGADQMVVKAFSGSPVRSVIIASVFGALSPFCSCGVIPLIAAMLVAGVPLAPVMAFWIASPIMDPEMFVLTTAGIGIDFAMAKAIFAIAVGLLAGSVVLLVQRYGGLTQVLKENVSTSFCSTECNSDNTASIQWRFWKNENRLTLFQNEFKQTALFLGKWLTLAFFLESLMVAYIDPAWIQHYLSGDSFLIIPLAAVIGMPSYLNGYAAIPLVGELINLGMSAGAAMAFMIAGAVSSIPAAIAVYSLVNLRVFFLYLTIGLSGSIISGVTYSLIS